MTEILQNVQVFARRRRRRRRRQSYDNTSSFSSKTAELKIMYTPVNSSFTIQKWGLWRLKLYCYVFMTACNEQILH